MFFQIFPVFFQIFHIFTVCDVIYDPFYTRRTPISENNSLNYTFFYSVRAFARIRQNYSKYWGGADAWAVPTSNFFVVGGGVHPSPPRSPPMWMTTLT